MNNTLERRSANFWRKHPLFHRLVSALSLFIVCISAMFDMLFIFSLAASWLMEVYFSPSAIPVTIGLTIACIIMEILCVELNLIAPGDFKS